MPNHCKPIDINKERHTLSFLKHHKDSNQIILFQPHVSPGCLWVQDQSFYHMGDKQTALLLSGWAVQEKHTAVKKIKTVPV